MRASPAQLLAAASGEERRDLRLKPPQGFAYLNKSKCYSITNVDDAAEYFRLTQALQQIGCAHQQRLRGVSRWTAPLTPGRKRGALVIDRQHRGGGPAVHQPHPGGRPAPGQHCLCAGTPPTRRRVRMRAMIPPNGQRSSSFFEWRPSSTPRRTRRSSSSRTRALTRRSRCRACRGRRALSWRAACWHWCPRTFARRSPCATSSPPASAARTFRRRQQKRCNVCRHPLTRFATASALLLGFAACSRCRCRWSRPWRTATRW